MLEMTLRKNDAPSYRSAVIAFPAIESELAKTLKEIGVGITTEQNCLVEKINGDAGALQRLVGQCVNADEMQYLAKRMDGFDKNEMQTFRAAAHAGWISTVKELINLTFNLHCYSLVSDFSDIATIGKNHELSRRMTMKMDEMRQTDFAEIGRNMIRDKKGAITPYGVLYPTGNKPEQIYNGEQFPAYSCRCDVTAVVTLEIGEYGSGIKYEYLYLPCHEVEIQKALRRLGVDSPHPCFTTLDCEAMSEGVYRIFTEDYPLSEHMDALNDLTRSYMGFDEEARAAFHAIVDMTQAKTPEDVAMLADNFYEFTAVPGIKTPTEYGRHMIIDSENYDFEKHLEEYIDFKGYGDSCIQNEYGSFTDYGYIAYRGTTPAVLELLQAEESPNMMIGGISR